MTALETHLNQGFLSLAKVLNTKELHDAVASVSRGHAKNVLQRVTLFLKGNFVLLTRKWG